MEKNARIDMDKFVLQKEEEYREVISYIGYSLFLFLSEELLKNNKNYNFFELGCSHYQFKNISNNIVNVLKQKTEKNREKVVLPDTLAVEYYKNNQAESCADLTKYILGFCDKTAFDSIVPNNYHWAMRFIICMVISNYSDESLFMEMLNKKLADEFYLKLCYNKYDKQGFSIDLNRYFDSVLGNDSDDVDKPKIKRL